MTYNVFGATLNPTLLLHVFWGVFLYEMVAMLSSCLWCVYSGKQWKAGADVRQRTCSTYWRHSWRQRRQRRRLYWLSRILDITEAIIVMRIYNYFSAFFCDYSNCLIRWLMSVMLWQSFVQTVCQLCDTTVFNASIPYLQLLNCIMTVNVLMLRIMTKARFPLPEFTARVPSWLVCIFWHLSTRAVNSGSGNRALVSKAVLSSPVICE